MKEQLTVEINEAVNNCYLDGIPFAECSGQFDALHFGVHADVKVFVHRGSVVYADDTGVHYVGQYPKDWS